MDWRFNDEYVEFLRAVGIFIKGEPTGLPEHRCRPGAALPMWLSVPLTLWRNQASTKRKSGNGSVVPQACP